MSAGFGFSVGDFIAVLKLVGTVIDALTEPSNAPASFRSLTKELWALENALIRVKRLDLDDNHIDKAALRQAACRCQETIDTFYEKIRKYQPRLAGGGTDLRLKDTWAKVKWALCKKDDVEAFRAEIRGHTGSIEILLSSIQIESTTTQSRKQYAQHKELARIIQDSFLQMMGMLTTITGTVTQSVQEGKALLESSAQVVQANLQIFGIVRDLQLHILAISGQVQRQQPVYLIDPLNMERPFHLEFVQSADALLAVLKDNLKGTGCGPAMIDDGHFAIEEMGTQVAINLQEPWNRCFRPGQRVAMSMIFKQSHTRNPSIDPRNILHLCPSCRHAHGETCGKDITCHDCGTVFRRIEELIDSDHPLLAGTVNSDMWVGSDQKKRAGKDDPSLQIRQFRRVRLVDKIYSQRLSRMPSGRSDSGSSRSNRSSTAEPSPLRSSPEVIPSADIHSTKAERDDPSIQYKPATKRSKWYCNNCDDGPFPSWAFNCQNCGFVR